MKWSGLYANCCNGGTVDNKELADFQFYGTPIYIGQDCKVCGGKHYCDAICFKFSPHSFYCLGCGLYRKHWPVSRLLKQYHMTRLLQSSEG